MTPVLRDAFTEPSRRITAEYRSIAFESGAPHEKYFGWTLLLNEPGLKIIAQSRGPVRRGLILVQGVPSTQIEEMLHSLQLLDSRTDLLLHDFDDLGGGDERIVAGRPWRRARPEERILNRATFVVDLALDDGALVKCMNPNYRRDLRKACDAGLRVEACDHPRAEVLQEFLSHFERMARERGLLSPRRTEIQRMFAGGDLTLFRVLAGSKMRAAATVYRAGDKGIWMMGVDGGKMQDGAGRILQFEIMRDLRARGIRWYDFGGVPSTDENDGIFRFKKGFGGRFVSLGSEYLRRPPLVRALVNAKVCFSAVIAITRNIRR